MYKFNFKLWVWNHMPEFFKKLNENSLFFRMLKALCSSFTIVLRKTQALQAQISLAKATANSLGLYGEELKLKREVGENDEDYRSKLLVLNTIYSGNISISNLKALTFSFLGITPEVYSSYRNQRQEYINTASKPLALGLLLTKITDTFKRLTYYILLPDLEGATVNRQRYINVILQINYGANIPIIVEKKDQGSGVILGRSTLGTIKSYITSIIEPDIIFVERWY